MKLSYPHYILVSMMILLISGSMFSQTFLGFRNSNYAGVYAIDLQPGALADNRLKYELNLFGVSATALNNYVDIKSNLFLGRGWSTLNNEFIEDVVPEDLNGKAKDIFFNTDFNLFSLMLAPSPKHSFGITLRQRNFLNIDGVNEPLAKMLYREINFPEQWDKKYNNDGLGIDVMSYLELGGAYSRVVYNKGKHFVKAGGRVKFLSGLWGLLLDADRLDYTFTDDDTLTIHDISASYAHSTAFDVENDNLSNFNPREFFLDGNTGFGLDLGVVYEHRPDSAENYFGEGKYRQERRDLNKYSYKIGISLVDLGSIKYKRSPTSGNFTGSIEDFYLKSVTSNDVPSVDSLLAAEFTVLESAPDFRMKTPTALSLQVDYRITNNLYVNFTPYWAFNKGTKKGQVHALTYYTLAPRFEGKWWGVALPISLADNTSMFAGLNVRLGPLVIGSHNIFNVLTQDFVKGADVHIAFRTPITFNKPKDRDRDGIPDKNDDCKEMPGIIALEGCPEPPLQLVMELPPYQLTELPYTHAFDSLNLKKPEMPEPVIVAEIPKVVEVRKPEVPVIEPPVIEDTVVAPPVIEDTVVTPPVIEPEPIKPLPKALTLMEEKPKPVAFIVKVRPFEATLLMVPLKNLEKIKIPKDPVPPEPPKGEFSRGEMARIMPYADLDGDGVPNIEDKCPEIPGVQINDGCPELGKGDYYNEDVFQSIYFDVAQFFLRPRSKTSLTMVVDFLKENPDTKVRLAGHTDNSGTERYNVGLSDDRCLSAKAYLISRGIEENRIQMVFYGETRPAATNETAVGKQLNRRVDIKLFTE